MHRFNLNFESVGSMFGYRDMDSGMELQKYNDATSNNSVKRCKMKLLCNQTVQLQLIWSLQVPWMELATPCSVTVTDQNRPVQLGLDVLGNPVFQNSNRCCLPDWMQLRSSLSLVNVVIHHCIVFVYNNQAF
jgi:hypothetical protein